MAVEGIKQAVDRQLQQLADEYAGWRFGLGGSGHWWAVRRNDVIRALSPDELRAALRRHLASSQPES